MQPKQDAWSKEEWHAPMPPACEEDPLVATVHSHYGGSAAASGGERRSGGQRRSSERPESEPRLGGHRSKLRGLAIAALVCLIAFFIVMTMRLQMHGLLHWPLFVDFFPLWLLPCIMYLATVDFAMTHIPAEGSLGRSVIIAGGFLGAATLLVLGVFIALRLHEDLPWPWMGVLAPLWPMLISAQPMLCFLIPGVLKTGSQKEFFVLFWLIWTVPLTAFLCGLKLDGELPSVHWAVALLPAELAVAGHAIISGHDPEEFSRPMAVLLCLVMLELRLDEFLEIPWAAIFLPILLMLCLSMRRVLLTRNEDF